MYDVGNRPIKETSDRHITIREYDALGNITRRLSSLGNDIRYDYDSLNRPSVVTVNGFRTSIRRNAQGHSVSRAAHGSLYETIVQTINDDFRQLIPWAE
jgi:YD repeat-containing protein